MAQIVKLRRSSVTGNKPTTSQLELGELAMNTYDGKIYFEKSGSTGESIEEILTTNTQLSGSLIISGSSHQITGSLTLSGSLKLPSSVRDYTNSTGSVGQVLQVTENGAVWVDNTATNTGDGRTAKQTFASATTWSFNHNLSEQYPVIELYDNSNQVIIPSTITAATANNLVITFAVPVAGTAVATVGGKMGPQGNQGPQGSNGYVGADGAQGPQGNQGPQGITGQQGNQGPTGFQGNQGPTGLQGTTGAQGNQGPTGLQGATGAQGSQGPTGLQGTTGAQGNQGPQGIQGATGSQGAVSSSARNVNVFTATANQTTFTVPGGYTVNLVDVFWNGVKQTVGVDYTASNGTTVVLSNGAASGDTIEIDNYLGEIGSQGNQGATGVQGDVGPQGATGAQGNQGSTGAQGVVGAQGSIGVQGTTGAQGNQGPTGLQGSTGSQGNQGPTGLQGTTGAQGNQGPTGAQGSQGTAGSLDAVARSGDTMTGPLNGTSATFSDTINITNGLTLSGNHLSTRWYNGDDTLFANYRGYNWGTTQFRNFHVYDGKESIVAAFNGSTKSSTFYGSISVGGTGYFGSDVFTYNNGGIFFSGGGSYSTGIFQNANGLNLQVSGSPVLRLAYTTGNATFTGTITSGGYLTNGSLTIGTPIDTGGSKAYFDASSINGAALTLRADSVGRTLRLTSDGTGSTVGAIDVNTNGLALATNTSHPIIFSPQATERLRITTGGNFGFNISSPSRHYVFSNPNSRGSEGFEINAQNGIITLLSYNRATSTYLPISLSEGTSNVLINSTTDLGHKLQVNGDINIPGGNKLIFNNEPLAWYIHARTTTSTANLGAGLKNMIWCGGGANEGLAITGSGTGAASLEVRNDGRVWVKENLIVGGTLTENSSIRYKENVETISYGLDKVLQMRGVTYTKKDNGIKELGLIAEEVNEILPDAVLKNEEGQPDSVSYGRITAVLIEAIKDLQQQINVLNSK